MRARRGRLAASHTAEQRVRGPGPEAGGAAGFPLRMHPPPTGRSRGAGRGRGAGPRPAFTRTTGWAAGWDALAAKRQESGPHPVGLAGHPAAAVLRRAVARWAEDSTSLGLSVLTPPSESYCEDETRRKRMKSLPSNSLPSLPAPPHSPGYTWPTHLDPRSPSRPGPRLPSSAAPACPPHGSHQRAPVSARVSPHPV